LPNNTILFIIIDKFDLNPVLVNINKLKPYKFIKDKFLQLILVKPSDLVTNEPIQTGELDSLLFKPKSFQHVEFEPVCNYLTSGHTKGTYVHV
jgi:hypothetical protein